MVADHFLQILPKYKAIFTNGEENSRHPSAKLASAEDFSTDPFTIS
jgi:hypothetical protein